MTTTISKFLSKVFKNRLANYIRKHPKSFITSAVGAAGSKYYHDNYMKSDAPKTWSVFGWPIYEDPKFFPSRPKCNLFVAKYLKDKGINVPFVTAENKTRIPLAQEWALNDLKGWKTIPFKDRKPGDVISYVTSHNNWHTGVVDKDINKFRSGGYFDGDGLDAFSDAVSENQPIYVRRFTGK